MSLIETIDQDIKKAMLAKDQVKLRGLRAIKSALLLARTEKGLAVEISEETEIKLLQKQIKQRKESVAVYITQNRPDLAQVEQEEIVVIEYYLPKQLDLSEIESDLKMLITNGGFSSIKDLGKLIGIASTHFAGRTEMKTVSDIAKKLLT